MPIVAITELLHRKGDKMANEKLTDKLKDLKVWYEPSPFQNRTARQQKDHNWSILDVGLARIGRFVNSQGDVLQTKIDDYDKRFKDQLTSNTDINEVINARRPKNSEAHKTLGDRLDAEHDKLSAEVKAANEKAKKTDVGYQSNDPLQPRELFQVDLDTMRNRIEALPGKINLGHITDTHYVIRSNYWGKFPLSSYGYTHIANIGYVSDLLDLVIAGGDNCDENSATKDTLYQQQRDFATTLNVACKAPSFLGIGNHDDNSVHAADSKAPGNNFLVTNADLAHLYFEDTNLFGEVRDEKSNYFYYNVPNSNIRVVWIDLYENPDTLDTNNMLKYPRLNTSIIQNDQLKWLATQVLKTDRDIVIFTHCPIAGTFDKPTTNWYNHDLLMELLVALQTHGSGNLNNNSGEFPVDLDYDFSGQNNSIVGVFSGHKHRDEYVEVNGINFILNNASVGQEFDGTSHYGTLQEDSFSVINIDEEHKEVKEIKFGRGKGVEFTYGQ